MTVVALMSSMFVQFFAPHHAQLTCGVPTHVKPTHQTSHPNLACRKEQLWEIACSVPYQFPQHPDGFRMFQVRFRYETYDSATFIYLHHPSSHPDPESHEATPRRCHPDCTRPSSSSCLVKSSVPLIPSIFAVSSARENHRKPQPPPGEKHPNTNVTT